LTLLSKDKKASTERKKFRLMEKTFCYCIG